MIIKITCFMFIYTRMQTSAIIAWSDQITDALYSTQVRCQCKFTISSFLYE